MGLLDNLLNTVNEGIGKAVEKVNAAAQEANAKAEAEGKALTDEEKEKQAQALEAIKGLGGMFSGAVEMAKKEMQAEVEAKAAAEAAIFENWEQNFPNYPKWDVGGSDFELEEMDPMNGYPSWRFCLKGRPFLVARPGASASRAVPSWWNSMSRNSEPTVLSPRATIRWI